MHSRVGSQEPLIHKWRLINYSFIFLKISLTNLISTCKIQYILYSKMSLISRAN